MCKKIFITATNTDIGKTYTTKLLLQSYAKKGLRVGVIKPIETGVIDGVFLDGEKLLTFTQQLNPEFNSFSIEDIVPISYELPSAPFIASDGARFDFNKVLEKIAQLEKVCDVVLIEGAGGLYVPIEKEFMMIDLIQELNIPTLLVTHCVLGCINDTLLSERALESYGISYLTTFNCKEGEEESFSRVSQPYFKAIEKKVLNTTKDIDTISELLYNL